MTVFPGLKARLITYNNRQQQRLDEAAARQARDEAVAAEAARETGRLIAAAIRASAPLPRAHVCEQPEWCLWCLPSVQAQKNAAIAEGTVT